MPSIKIELFEDKLKTFFAEHNRVAVAFSGGCDSCLVLALAKKYCKDVKAYMVFTDFQMRSDLLDARNFARACGVDLEVFELDILKHENMQQNPENRCYLCKSLMFQTIRNAAVRDGFDTLVDGTNLSDDPSNRPGFKALKEYDVISPLRLCGLEKSDVRALSAALGLISANKPSFSCIATKFPYGTILSSGILRQKERELKAL